MVDCRSATGDLEKSLILLLAYLRWSSAPESVFIDTPEKLMRGEVDPRLWTNALSLSVSTGISKETVRRKVNELLRDNLLIRRGNLLAVHPQGLHDQRFGLRALKRFAEDMAAAANSVRRKAG